MFLCIGVMRAVWLFAFFVLFFFVLMIRLPLRSTLFPYTTLFRSCPSSAGYRPRRCRPAADRPRRGPPSDADRKSTRLNSSHVRNSYAVFCLKKKKPNKYTHNGGLNQSAEHNHQGPRDQHDTRDKQ